MPEDGGHKNDKVNSVSALMGDASREGGKNEEREILKRGISMSFPPSPVRRPVRVREHFILSGASIFFCPSWHSGWRTTDGRNINTKLLPRRRTTGAICLGPDKKNRSAKSNTPFCHFFIKMHRHLDKEMKTSPFTTAANVNIYSSDSRSHNYITVRQWSTNSHMQVTGVVIVCQLSQLWCP